MRSGSGLSGINVENAVDPSPLVISTIVPSSRFAFATKATFSSSPGVRIETCRQRFSHRAQLISQA
jgi:hypothetical protein